MMYLVNQSSSLLKHHLFVQDVEYQFVQTDDPNEVINCVNLGSPILRPTIVIEYTGKKKIQIEKKNKFNTVYLLCKPSLMHKQSTTKEWIKPLKIDENLYLDQLNKLKGIFTAKAKDRFKKLFKQHPHKLNCELMNLLLWVQTNKRKITEEDIIDRYEYTTGQHLKHCLSLIKTPQFYHKVQAADTNQLWHLFVERGQYPSVLEQFLDQSGQHKELQGLLYLKQAVIEHCFPLKEACLLYSLWLYADYQTEHLKRWLLLQ